MILIINGSVGSGKTAVSWELQTRFDSAVMLDGDYIGAVHPFEIYDNQRIEYLYDTLQMLVGFHHAHGYQNFVINYVFESDDSLRSLIRRLSGIIPDIHCFWLTCSDQKQKERIAQRNTDQADWELRRFSELNAIQARAAAAGYIGDPINTTDLSIPQVADRIWTTIADDSPEKTGH